ELAPASDEIETLAARRRSLQHREKILEALQTAENALEGDKGAVAALAQAGKAIARVADKAAGLAELLATLDRVAEDVGEAAQELTRFARAIDAEPESLDRIEERLFALRAVARKHNVAPESLGALQQDLKKRLELLEDQGDRLTALAKAVETTQHAYKKRAEELSAKRRKAADELAKAIQRELPPLKLERARFVAEVAASPEEQWSREGMDRIAFLASTNPGATPGALQKVASGGELARFMLALKVVLAASDPIPTLVFDEVDTGIGGATASAVGERLARLAADVQILVVTHSPQVAARGSMHIRVAKQIQAQKARTATEILDETARVEEIARMLAGTETTDAARQAARSLLRDAPPSEKKKTKRASSGNLRG
ncbi:MAG: DNA repair protein RecN, partial [Alphaproteobacteria bacterium]|nr:DNA repair protein RecN [Alphaproteobacteria bacterium]